MSSLEEIENRMNQTKNILNKCALEGQINIGLMISDIEYLLNEIKNLVDENNSLHEEINERIKLKIENEKIVDNEFISINKIGEKIEEKIKEYNVPIFDVLDKLPIMPSTIERGCGAKDGIIYVLQELLQELLEERK